MFYSQLFVVQKALGAWRPVIDFSSLNESGQQTLFQMELNQSVLRSVKRFDWMISINLKDAYLQVTIHPDSRKFLRFVVDDKTFQFRALCFGLSTAPQVFTRVMAPVSAMLHSQGIRMLRYSDDWLILASTHQEALQVRDAVLQLCSQLGIVVILQKSCLDPSQTGTYLGMVLVSPSLRAFPTEKRVSAIRTQIKVSLLQAAKRAYLEVSSRASSFFMSSCPRGASSDAIPSTSASGALGFCGQRGHGALGSGHSVRPQVLVRSTSFVGRGVSSCAPAGSSVLV